MFKYLMRNTKIEVYVQIINEDYTISSFAISEVKKLDFHDFVDEFEGELVIKHLEGNKYMIRMNNADFTQTKEKLHSSI